MVFKVEDAYEDVQPGQLVQYEEKDRNSPSWRVTWNEAKLLLIASTGFFIDAYDLFSINLVIPILNYRYNHKLSGTIPNIVLDGGVLKAAANLGCVPGQIGFGLLGDVFGRKFVYGKELIILMIGTILVVATPNFSSATSVFTWITIWRVVMGIGIGGDYPMSAAVVSDRANLRRRGVMLSFIFSMQGWGNFAAGIVSIVVLAIFKPAIQGRGEYGQFNAVWRIIVGLVLVPCLGTLYQRLTLAESAKWKNAQALREDPSLLKRREEEKIIAPKTNDTETGLGTKGAVAAKSEAWKEFIVYFSEWRHLKTLIGTTATWFLVDITFYGINLNQSIVITAIGLNKSKEPWQFLYDNTKANLIITAAGFLPGYYATMLLIEKLGRKNIQFFGFLLEALFLGIVAGDFHALKSKPAAFVVCFAFLQFFFNFGANATTFIIPAEVYPTRVRGFAHGLSAGCGKLGAVLSSLGFATWAAKIGTDKVLWIFFGISILGAIATLILPETTGRDADMIDLQERQEAAGYLNYGPAA
ncbi:MFS inorganic phosphate transporter, partial [Atractiella rhizophila]